MVPALLRLLETYDLVAIYAFGSRGADVARAVREGVPLEETPHSDLDLAVQPRRGTRLTISQKVELTQALEDLFRAGRVDLVVATEASPYLALDAVCGELLACSDTYEHAEFELYVLRRAADLAPFERERRELILGGDAY